MLLDKLVDQFSLAKKRASVLMRSSCSTRASWALGRLGLTEGSSWKTCWCTAISGTGNASNRSRNWPTSTKNWACCERTAHFHGVKALLDANVLYPLDHSCQ